MGAWRTILDNCMLSEDYQLLDSDCAAVAENSQSRRSA